MVPFQVLMSLHVSGIPWKSVSPFRGKPSHIDTINGDEILVIRVTIKSHLDPILHLSRLAAVPLNDPAWLGKLRI